MAEKRIENVVFDMGGVLLEWDPMAFPLHFTTSEADASLVCSALFESDRWALLDAGAISGDTMLMCAHAALPERLHELADKSYAAFPSLQPVIEGTNELGFALKDAGYGVYILSNVSVRFPDEFLPRIPIHTVLDGYVTSAQERLMKPDPAIFELFAERFSLDPATCLFIDDSMLNCMGAEKAGWQSFHFTGDVDALKAVLRERGAREF